jgi:hypothetical protein
MMNAHQVTAILYRALAAAEQHIPATARGGFIGVGNQFQFFSELADILKPAARDVLIVDPYMDATALTDVAVLVAERVPVRLMADRERLQASLTPAVQRWRAEYSTRPLLCKVAKRKSLHDRLVVVDGVAWDLSQSIKDFSAKSPGSISKCDPEIGSEKVSHYETVWNADTSTDL